MSERRSLRPADRQFRIEAVPRETPDLHKLAQVFLGMALARAEADKQGTARGGPDQVSGPSQRGEVE